MKNILLALLFTSGLVTSNAQAQVCMLADGFEPNDDCANAQVLSFLCQPGLTVSKASPDWYRVQVPPQMDLLIGVVIDDPAASVSLTTRFSCPSVPHISVPVLPARSSHSYSNPSPISTVPVFINITVNSGSVADCTIYDLDLRIVPTTLAACAPDVFEPNNCCEMAAPYPMSSLNFTSATRLGDPDWFYFDLDDGHAIDIAATVSPNASGSINLRLYDFCGANPIDIDPNYVSVVNVSGVTRRYWLETTYSSPLADCPFYHYRFNLTQESKIFCFATASFNCTACPCGNDNPPGQGVGGCLNSAGTSGSLTNSGVASVSSDTLRFEAQNLPPSSFGVLLSGSRRAPTNPSHPCFGFDSGLTSPSLDGLRCVVQNQLRHGGRPSDLNGNIGTTTNGWGAPSGPAGGLILQGGFAAGQLRHFQLIYRDLPSAQCMTGLNTTNGISVVILP